MWLTWFLTPLALAQSIGQSGGLLPSSDLLTPDLKTTARAALGASGSDATDVAAAPLLGLSATVHTRSGVSASLTAMGPGLVLRGGGYELGVLGGGYVQGHLMNQEDFSLSVFAVGAGRLPLDGNWDVQGVLGAGFALRAGTRIRVHAAYALLFDGQTLFTDLDRLDPVQAFAWGLLAADLGVSVPVRAERDRLWLGKTAAGLTAAYQTALGDAERPFQVRLSTYGVSAIADIAIGL